MAMSGADRANSRSTVVNIQILRCFAAMAVVWHHLVTRLNSEMGGPYWGFTGMAGVDVFFVISGFIMFHTTQGGRSLSRFWTDRAIRIVPLYWLALALVIGLWLVGEQPDGVKQIDAGDALAAFLFIPDVRADGVPYPVLDVGWTLVFEAYFYVVFGLTFFLRSQAASLKVLTGLFVVLALVRLLTPGLPFALEFWFRPVTLEFVAGGMLAMLYRSDLLDGAPAPLLESLGRTAVWIGVIALMVMGWRVGWRLNGEFELRLIAFGLPAMLIVLGALLQEKAGAVWRGELLLLLGAASYSIYLSHQFVIEGVEAILMAANIHVSLGADLMAIGLGLLVAAVGGVAVHLFIEKPITQLLKRLTHTESSHTVLKPSTAGPH